MAGKRKSLSNKIRFEVFKRDSFTCQYCGRKSPDVILNVDHIKPVNDGGTNDLLNLITSCFDCNNGKRAIPLDKQDELDKQRNELELLSERRNQIDMMFKWKNELMNIKDYEVQKVNEYLSTNYGFSLSEHGIENMKKYLKKYGLSEVLTVIDIAIDQYKDNEIAINSIGKICNNRKIQKEHPEYERIYYLSKIGQNRCGYYNKKKMIILLKNNYKEEDYDDLLQIFRKCENWSELINRVEVYFDNPFERGD